MRYHIVNLLAKKWSGLWMRSAGPTAAGRLSMRLAAWCVPPYKDRIPLAHMGSFGFFERTAILNHPDFKTGNNCFIGDRVVINERKSGGSIRLGKRVEILRDCTLETGMGGRIEIGDDASIHPSCHMYSYLEPIVVGKGVMIAPLCAIYSYDHGISASIDIRRQPPCSKGPVIIGDEAWLGVRTTVLSGVTIGEGAVIGAGSIVSKDIPAYAIAVGSPARVVKKRL